MAMDASGLKPQSVGVYYLHVLRELIPQNVLGQDTKNERLQFAFIRLTERLLIALSVGAKSRDLWDMTRGSIICLPIHAFAFIIAT